MFDSHLAPSIRANICTYGWFEPSGWNECQCGLEEGLKKTCFIYSAYTLQVWGWWLQRSITQVNVIEYAREINVSFNKCFFLNDKQKVRRRPHVYVFDWKRRFFSSFWPTVRTFPVNLVTKTHLFKNAGLSFTYGRTKTEVFEYDDVMHHILVRISIALWTGENDSNIR